MVFPATPITLWDDSAGTFLDSKLLQQRHGFKLALLSHEVSLAQLLCEEFTDLQDQK